MRTLDKWCEKKGIAATSEMVGHNPNMPDVYPGSYHYKVTLRRKTPRRQMTVNFTMGPASCREPTPADVLSCLILDSSAKYAGSFEDWASDLGFDSDSREAERIYKLCLKTAVKLERFLDVEEIEEAAVLEH